MAQILALKIDVTKIEKGRLFKGEKGTYLDCIVMLKDEPDQYNNIGMIVQSVSKEEKDRGVKGPILGNAKRIGVTNTPNTGNGTSEGIGANDDGLPF